MQPDFVVVTQRVICQCEPVGAMQHDPTAERIRNNLQNIRFIPSAGIPYLTAKPTLQRLLDAALVETLEGDVCPNIINEQVCGEPIRYVKL